jgi:hypothetical protein
MYCHVLNWLSADVSEVRAVSIIRAMTLIALMMKAARTFETPVDIQLRTWHYIPEDSELHTPRRENLKSHISCHTFSSDMDCFICMFYRLFIDVSVNQTV